MIATFLQINIFRFYVHMMHWCIVRSFILYISYKVSESNGFSHEQWMHRHFQHIRTIDTSGYWWYRFLSSLVAIVSYFMVVCNQKILRTRNTKLCYVQILFCGWHRGGKDSVSRVEYRMIWPFGHWNKTFCRSSQAMHSTFRLFQSFVIHSGFVFVFVSHDRSLIIYSIICHIA